MKPSLDAEGGALWDAIVSEHAARKTLGSVDTSALRSLCETWSLFCAAMVHARENPIDKDARCSVLAYLSQCVKLGALFGWTPADRASLKIGGSNEKQDSVSAFARRRTK